MKNKFLGTGEKGYHPLRKLKVMLAGLRFSMIDIAVSYKLILSIIVIVPSLFLHHWVDTSIIILATVMMLISEMFNTVIEALCDYIQEDFDPKIGMIKDIAAAATGIAILAWIITLGVEVYELFHRLP
jgi:diacylglycerol kinase (ATP)